MEANTESKATYSKEEIAKIAPGYRGKPENFDPSKKGKRGPPKPITRLGPKTDKVTPPTHLQTKSTPQRNDPIISEAIFGVDVSVTEILPRQYFHANYVKLPAIAAEVYDAYRTDEKQLERVIVREEIAYYATAMLWLKLLDIKAKQGNEALTSAEKDIRKATYDEEFNIPQPIYAYLKEIGAYTDQMGKETELAIPPLLIAVAQNFGGYQANAISADTHTLFEEIPSLGISGDMVMALCATQHEPTPNFHVGLPAGAVTTANLVGKFSPIGVRQPEIAQFDEFVKDTRFNLKYLRNLSDTLGKFCTFRNEKVKFSNQTKSGGETQVIKTRPSESLERESWIERSVQATSASTSSTAQMGAAMCFGFQLYKEDGPGDKRSDKTANWSCITGPSWEMPDDWYNNRNARRDVPEGVGTERFRVISLRQDLHMQNIVRRMIKTTR